MEERGISYALMVGAMVCLVSFMLSMTYVFLKKYVEDQDKKERAIDQQLIMFSSVYESYSNYTGYTGTTRNTLKTQEPAASSESALIDLFKRFDKDILLHVIIPKKKAKGFFKKVKTTALDFAILNVCVVKDGRFEIVIGARPGIATRAVRTSEFLDGKDIDDKVIEEALDILEEEIKFSKNAKASKEYRSDLALVYVKRGIKEVIK